MPWLAQDQFNRANENPILSPWVNKIDASLNPMTITSNIAQASSLASDCWAYRPDVSVGSDQWVRAALTVTGTVGGGSGICLCLRVDPSATTLATTTGYRIALDHAAATNIFIERFNAGTATTLVSFTQAWSDGDFFEFWVQGATCTLWRNGAVIQTVNDATPVLTGVPGMGYSSTETSASLDFWECGDFTQPRQPPNDYRVR